ncbi:DUF2203 domain-containing protein [Paenibacillus aurantius]|uniref:DUF2203 domain-containing protein n=1 Tax=Paenibacillus aurantius TaxID=2918900 RepID=A0AA96LAW0_9BACL|nr:DUF2203 domain-containing protein [Paenibacillus aurantius]WNQ10266.1 DUF2203 domain-containing protein [Paenibacillus aurantius]
MTRKYFTPEEANALLPSVKQDLEKLQQTKREFELKYRELQQLKENTTYASVTGEDSFFEQECELEFMQIEAKSLIDSLGMKGAEIKDIDRGLIDFPARIGGEDVLLCWMQGEESIRYYHGVSDGFAGRKRLDS